MLLPTLCAVLTTVQYCNGCRTWVARTPCPFSVLFIFWRFLANGHCHDVIALTPASLRVSDRILLAFWDREICELGCCGPICMRRGTHMTPCSLAEQNLAHHAIHLTQSCISDQRHALLLSPPSLCLLPGFVEHQWVVTATQHRHQNMQGPQRQESHMWCGGRQARKRPGAQKMCRWICDLGLG